MTIPGTADERADPGGVLGLFLYLTWAGLRNRIRSQVRRMRSPRYVLPLLLGVLYVWFFLFRGTASGRAMTGSLLGSTSAATAAALGLLALAVNWWLFGGDRGALAFSPAEVDFLFPAPLSRRQLMHFKLLRAQALIAVNVVVWLLITRRGSPGVPLVLRAIGFWALISTLQLHRLAASLVRTSAVAHGAAGARRNAVALGVIGAVGAALIVGLARHWALISAVESPTGLAHALSLAFAEAPARWALLPASAVLAPTFATSIAEWQAAVPASLGIVAFHYLWVLRSDVAFEEAAVEATAKRAERLQSSRARAQGRFVPARASGEPAPARQLPFGLTVGGRAAGAPPPWIRLRPTGPAAGAITWKNVVAMTRGTRPATVVLPLLAVGLVIAFGSTRGEGGQNLMHVATVMLATVAVMLVVAGPHYVRNDLRLDMPRLELLRAYPLRGRDVVAAELAAPLAVLTAIQLCALALALASAFGARSIDAADLGRPAVWAAVVAGLVTLPALNAAGIAVQNGAALLFPSWMRLGSTRTPGVESLGQNLLAMLVTYLMLLLLLIVPVALAAAAFAVTSPDAVRAALGGVRGMIAPGPWPLVAAAATGVLALWAEVGLAVLWLGRVFERTEPGSD